MKKFSFLIFALTIFIALPSYSDQIDQNNSFGKMRKRFQKIDKDGDGLLSKSEMIDAHRARIDNLFNKFDKNSDSKLSRKELRDLRQEMKKRIYKKNKGV